MGATYTLDWSDTSVGPTVDYTHANGLVFVDSSIPTGVGATKSLMWGKGSPNDSIYIELPVTLDAAGTVSFYVKTSTESGWDWLQFYVDGSPPASSQWSGTTAWTQVSFSLSSGSHTLKWAFTHDGGATSGSDNVWIALLQVTNMTSVPAVVNTSKTAQVYDFEDGSIPSIITTSTWTNGTDSPITGSRSMRSPATTANNGVYDLVIDTSCLTENGVISYDYKREAEQPDYLAFYVDSTQIYRTPGTGVTTESGSQHRVIAAGASTFTVQYAKDSSVNYLGDAVWIDNLSLPYIVSSGYSASVSLSGSGTLTASVVVAFSASASFSGSGTLTNSEVVAFNASCPLSGSGTLSFSDIVASTTFNIFEGAAPAGITTYDGSSGGVNVGTDFYTTASGWLTQMRYLQGATNGETQWNARQCALWRVDVVGGTSYGYTRVVGPFTMPVPTVENSWVTYDLATPYELTPGQLYRVVIFHPSGGYPATSHYFDGTVDRVHGIVTIPAAANVPLFDMQGTYKYTPYVDDCPDSTYNNTTYYSDVTVTSVNPAGGTDFTASGSLSGSGTLSFSGIVAGGIQSCSLSGSGTLTATATPNPAVTKALTGSGTLTGVDQTPAMNPTGSLAGSGVLSSTINGALYVDATLSGSGTLTGPHTVEVSSSRNLSGSGTLSGVGKPGYSAAINLSGSGTLNTTLTSLDVKVNFTQSSTGTLSLVSAFNITVTKALSGAGTLTSVRSIATSASIALSGEGTFHGAKYQTATLHITGELSPRRWAGDLGPQRWEGSL